MTECDVAIVGGGPVGAALALALRGCGMRTALFEARPATAPLADTRTLALAHGSRLILERLAVWAPLNVTPIATVHVSQRGEFGRAQLAAAELGLPALGYVLRYAELQQALQAALATSAVVCLNGAKVVRSAAHADAVEIGYEQNGAAHSARAKLLVVADGGRVLNNLVAVGHAERDYQQYAVVAQVTTELPHRHVAYERFTDQGPAALLPAGDGYALVWTAKPAQAQQICALDDAAFLKQLQQHFGDRRGRFTHAGPRASFPLLLKHAEPTTAARSVLIGNAAQTLHPVAGQGFNLGLRDAWELAQTLLASEAQQIGAPAMLAAYRNRRRLDRSGGIYFTDALVRLFSTPNSPLRAMLGLGISAFDCLPPVRRLLARRMIFGAAG